MVIWVFFSFFGFEFLVFLNGCGLWALKRLSGFGFIFTKYGYITIFTITYLVAECRVIYIYIYIELVQIQACGD